MKKSKSITMKHTNLASDLAIFRLLELNAVDAEVNTWAAYFDAVKKADKNYMGEKPVRFQLTADSGEKRLCYILCTVSGDKLKEYGAIGFAYATRDNGKGTTHVALRNFRVLGSTTANFHTFQFMGTSTHYIKDALTRMYDSKCGEADEVASYLTTLGAYNPKSMGVLIK